MSTSTIFHYHAFPLASFPVAPFSLASFPLAPFSLTCVLLALVTQGTGSTGGCGLAFTQPEYSPSGVSCQVLATTFFDVLIEIIALTDVLWM